MDVAFLTEQGHKIRKLPRWMCLLNPLTAKVLLNAVAVIAPNTALSNGLGMANMALGGYDSVPGTPPLAAWFGEAQAAEIQLR